MSKTAAGTKETALRAMREGTAAKVDKAALKLAADKMGTALLIAGKKKGGKGTKKKPKPKGY